MPLDLFDVIIGWAVPIYGDIKIHEMWSEVRANAREKIKEIKSKDDVITQREKDFRRELTDLLEKYDIKEEIGSLVSFPSQYVAKETSDFFNTRLRSTVAPEVAYYFFKYFLLAEVYYQFLHH